MGLGDLFWLFIIFMALQPWLRQKALEAGRVRLIRQIEEERKSRVVLLVHRQETLSVLGIPLFRYIDMQDAEQVIRAIHLTDNEVPLDLMIHSPGGLVLASLQIARAIQAHPAKVTVFVPHMAMSGGTLIALAADEIVMDCHAVLGPVDPQIGQIPAASLLRVRRQKPASELDDQTLIQADVAEKALGQLKNEVFELLDDKLPRDKADELAERLSQGLWTHDHPLSFNDAKALGLPVTPEIPSRMYKLMELYPQSTHRQPAVQYIPVPYRDSRGGSSGTS